MSQKSVPIITCRKCDGSGKTPLPEALLETFRAINRGGSTTRDLHLALPYINETAQNNRLEDLRALDLVIRIREGKFWRYHRTATVRSGRVAK